MSDSTKILRLRLENFIGIFRGLGLYEIEIDFTKTEKRLILLLGGNGKGKSTIQSTLHPFMGSFDNRTDLIIDGKVGKKEIDIQMNDFVYKIKHHYGKTKKSTITKVHPDGKTEELNPAGTVRNFPGIIEQELGLTEDFFKLIKIGSKAENFIDLSNTERKEFMGKFTPDIEPYLAAYKNVSAKHSETSKELRGVSDELGRLDPQASVQKSISILQVTVKGMRDTIAKNSAKREVLLKEIEANEDALNELLDLEQTIDKKVSHRAIEQERVNELNDRYKGKLVNEESTIESVTEETAFRSSKIEEREKELNKLRISAAELGQEIRSLREEIKRADIDIKRLSEGENGESVQSLKQLLAQHEEKFSGTAARLPALNIDTSCFETIYKEHIQDDSIELDTKAAVLTETLGSFVLRNKPSRLTDYLNDYEIGSVDDFAELVRDTVTTLQGEEAEASDALKLAKELYQKLKAESDAALKAKELLNLCSMGEKCCLYAKVNDYTDDNSTVLSSAKKDVTSKEEALNDIKAEILNEEAVLTYLTQLIDAVRSDYDGNKEVYKYICSVATAISGKETSNVITFTLSADTKTFERIEAKIKSNYNVKRILMRLHTIYTSIVKTKSAIASYSEAESTITLLETNKVKVAEKIPSLEERFDALNEEIDESESKLVRVKRTYTTLMNILEAMSNASNINKEISELEKARKKISKVSGSALKARDTISELDASIQSEEEELETVQKELDGERLKLVRIEEYNERKNKLEGQRSIYAYIKDALDVKSGIPLVLVGDYLNAIRDATNRLLNIAFKGKFYIDFEISDKEFNIPVFTDGVKSAKDVSECSQGEVSMVKTSLSLGIVGEAIRNTREQYNIVYLDEIDSELDVRNKMLFLDILERQLNALNSTQCFVITHNNCFFASDAGMILLPQHQVDLSDEMLMMSKEVIFEA